MDDHYLEIEEVSSLADHFHISYGYMARLFQTSLNMTISDYLNSVRIRHIEQDLIATDETVSDLCLRHGYAKRSLSIGNSMKNVPRNPADSSAGGIGTIPFLCIG